MDKVYNELKKSINHLSQIESALNDNQIYQNEIDKLENDTPVEFYELFYATQGRKNQMALADIVEYIFTGRGDYIAKELKSFDSFYKILLRVSNIFLLQDSLLCNNYNLRIQLINNLSQLNVNFDPQKIRLIQNFKQSLAPDGTKNKNRKDAYDALDELMPKILGTPNELIAYASLIRKRVGYVVPLLLNQRLYKGKIDRNANSLYTKNYNNLLQNRIKDIKNIIKKHRGFNFEKLIKLEKTGQGRKTLINYLKSKTSKIKSTRDNIDWISPPDFLIITSNNTTYGIEVGSGKTRQGNKFTSITGIPIIVTFSDLSCSYRCPICKKWILFSDFAVNHGIDQKYLNKDKVYFDNLNNIFKDYDQGVCHSTIKTINSSKRHYHYKCAKQYKSFKDKEIFYYLPYIEGIRNLIEK